MSGSRSRSIYGSTAGGIDMRAEFTALLRGDDGQPRLGEYAIFRKMRREPNGKPTLCPRCRKIGVQESRIGSECGLCLGVGYLWDEEWVIVYRWSGTSVSRSRSGYKKFEMFGVINTDLAVIYMEYYGTPTTEDKLISVVTDSEGKPVLSGGQYQRLEMFDFRTVDRYRADNAKLEYWRVTANKISIGRFGQPLATHEPEDRRMP